MVLCSVLGVGSYTKILAEELARAFEARVRSRAPSLAPSPHLSAKFTNGTP